jgi:hypothetical protein
VDAFLSNSAQIIHTKRLSEATEATLAWSPDRQSFRVTRGAYVALVLIIMFGVLAALAAPPAHATTVKGTFKYTDRQYSWDNTSKQWKETRTDRPIVGAKVEIWRFRPRFLGIWTWDKDATAWTDPNGSISVNMPFAQNRVVYGIRVFATNDAAVVWPGDNFWWEQKFNTIPFYSEPREGDGQIMHKTESSPSSVLDFGTYTFDSQSSQYFNIAEVARQGKIYAENRRAPGETDSIGKANFQPTLAPITSYYNYLFDTVVLNGGGVINSGDTFEDFVILHEYAHYLEEQISSFAPVPSYHSGCLVRSLDKPIINSPEHAWMEGFADYFSQAVAHSVPRNTLAGREPELDDKGEVKAGFYDWGYYEYADWYCDNLQGKIPGDYIENFVAGTLWDLFDEPKLDYPLLRADGKTDPRYWGGSEAHDTLARRDKEIFQIFDRELDVYGVWPNITHFRRAWMDRCLPGGELSSIMVRHHILLPDSAVGDFCPTQNTSSPWSYGYRALGGSDSTLYTSHTTPWGAGIDRWSSQGATEPMVAYNGTGQTASYLTINHPPDVLNLHPGSAGQKSVVRWTAPFSGTVTIQGRFQGIDKHGTTTDVAVAHNSTTLFSRNINGYGAEAPFLITRSVAAGDTIDFSVGYGSNRNYYNDSTGLSATMFPK